jgi:hypothetical protein
VHSRIDTIWSWGINEGAEYRFANIERRTVNETAPTTTAGRGGSRSREAW